MSPIIEQIAREAKAIFSNFSDPNFKDKFNNLVKFVNTLQASDLKVRESVREAPGYIKRIFPCYYIEVVDTEIFVIGVYILKPGVTVPLHNHPGMHGIVKTLEGSVRISSYTSMADEQGDKTPPQDVKDQAGRYAMFIPVSKHEPLLVGVKDQPFVLGPKERNFREISAVGETLAVILEVLAPPFHLYERVCTFYKPLETAEQDAAIKTWLVKTPPSIHYYGSNIPYRGPEIKL